MKCTICKKGRAEGRTLYRINEVGVPGLWACREHLDQTDGAKLDPIVEEIVSAIEHAGRWNQPSVIKPKAKAALSLVEGEDTLQPPAMPRFPDVSCSNCGQSFGPGDHGFSHCEHHKGRQGYRR